MYEHFMQACDLVTGNYYFYAWQWPNSSCPFLCEEADACTFCVKVVVFMSNG